MSSPRSQEADAWPELARARELGLTQVALRLRATARHVITAAAPVGLQARDRCC
jgi:two-component system sensor histidine kinase ChvG